MMMKRILILLVVLSAFVSGAAAQERAGKFNAPDIFTLMQTFPSDRIQRGCSGLSTRAEVRVNSNGSISITPCTGQGVTIGGPVTFSAAGVLMVANNLSDVASAATSRTNLGLGTGNSPTFTNVTATGTIIAAGFKVSSGGTSDFKDENNNVILKFTPVVAAVNTLSIENSDTGFRPGLRATGSDTNVGMTFSTKGSEQVVFNLGAAQLYMLNQSGFRDFEGTYNLMPDEGGIKFSVNSPICWTSGASIFFGVDTCLKRSADGVLEINNGTPGTLRDLSARTVTASTSLTVAGAAITNNIVQNSKSADYTTVLADAGKHLYHPSADTSARTWTIDSNANVAYPIGTTLTFVNDTSGGDITISITDDTLVLAGDGSTGSRTLTENGVATAIKVTSTRWIINGTNLD